MTSSKAAASILAVAAFFTVGPAQAPWPPGEPGAPDDPMSGPFSLCRPLAPTVATQLTLQAVVELSGSGRVTTREATYATGDKEQIRFFEFDVKVVAGDGVEAGKTYRCVSQGLKPPSAPSQTKNRYLLLGWPSKQTGRLVVEPYSAGDLRQGTLPLNVEGGPKTLYAQVLLPTSQLHPASGASVAGKAYRNMAEAMASGAPPITVRQVTFELSRVTPNYMDCGIEGARAYDWLRTVIGTKLAGVSQTTAIQRFRIGGLLATWDRPKKALPYLRALPKLMEELHLTVFDRSPGDVRDDLLFLNSLDLVSGVDPDEVLNIVLQYPFLRYLALDARLAKPSIENQRKILGSIDDPDPNVRAKALSQFAGWYAEWDKMAAPRWSSSAQNFVIDNEDGLRTYWRGKIAGPTPPSAVDAANAALAASLPRADSHSYARAATAPSWCNRR